MIEKENSEKEGDSQKEEGNNGGLLLFMNQDTLRKSEPPLAEEKRSKQKLKKEESDDVNIEGEEETAKSTPTEKKTTLKRRLLVPLVLILLALIFSTYLRMMPAYLPITDEWAKEEILNAYQKVIAKEIAEQYPLLSSQQRQLLVERELDLFREENKQEIRQEIVQRSQYYKNHLQDENGDTYLIGPDPYFWYAQARNVIKHGHLGDKIINGTSHFSLRDGRLGKETSMQLHPYIGAYLFRFLQIFDPDISLMRAMFLLPVIIMGLAIIPTFFIGRKIAGNIGGAFAALFLAINTPLLMRTTGGLADTDCYNVLFPLLISWLFLEAYTAKKSYQRGVFSALSGFFVGVYAVTWGGWSFIFFFIIAAMLITFLLIISSSLVQNRQNKNKFYETVKESLAGKATVFIGFILSSGLFVSLFQGLGAFLRDLTTSFNRFTIIKKVAVTNIWPGIHTTVAEFQAVSLPELVSQMGGKAIVLIALIGILLTLRKKANEKRREYIYFILLVIWVAGTVYSLTRGVRFVVLVAPPLALALGSAFGQGYKQISKWLHEGIYLDQKTSKSIALIGLALLLIAPLSSAQEAAKNISPGINDAWYDALTKIKGDSPEAIITSWWDFGHWFTAIAERKVTFDGGDQKKRIHWVGKVLLTEDEGEAIAILRMLNCGQEKATGKLEEYTNDPLRAVKVLYEIFLISNREKAYRKYQELGLTKEQAETMLELTHCKDLIPNYFITSGDMALKSNAWGHYGRWDFQRAAMYFYTKKLPGAEAVAYLKENFNLSEEPAGQIHQEIKNAKADDWIAPPLTDIPRLRKCQQISTEEFLCQMSSPGTDLALQININTLNVTIKNHLQQPYSLIYLTEGKVKEKFFTGELSDFSVILVPDDEGYLFTIAHPLLARSLFTRLFFFEGYGLKCFSKFDDVRQFTGERIITWKIDFDCRQENKVFNQPSLTTEKNI